MSANQFRVGTCTRCDERVWLTPSGACSRGHGAEPISRIEIVPEPPTPLPATVFCRSCGSELFETVPVCGNCGTPQPVASAESGPNTSGSQQTYQIGGSRVAVTLPPLPPLAKAPVTDFEDSYYQNEFTKIYTSKEMYRGQFNWAALIFGPFWALARDLQMVGLGWLLVAVIIGGISGGTLSPLLLAYNVYFGIKANYLRYVAKYKGIEAFISE